MYGAFETTLQWQQPKQAKKLDFADLKIDAHPCPGHHKTLDCSAHSVPAIDSTTLATHLGIELLDLPSQPHRPQQAGGPVGKIHQSKLQQASHH
jgi:hypothetical protein